MSERRCTRGPSGGWDEHDARITARINATSLEPAYRCVECRVGCFTAKQVAGAIILCLPCFAKHRLRCDACSGKDVLAQRCSDNAWRCDACAAEYRATPPESRVPGAMAASGGG